ncbi:cysteine desulfurase family protein [Brachybacterium huguangmaarense]
MVTSAAPGRGGDTGGVHLGRAYLDHAATSALRPAARSAFLAAADVLGNPASTHASGRRARAVLDDALDSLATDLGVPRTWLILTSGGTEADNLAVRGGALGVRARDAARDAVAVCATDHPATLEAARSLGADGFDVRELPVGPDGLLRADAVEAALADGRTGVVSAALANNETGICQDIGALAEAAARRGALVHTDAVQAVGHADLPDLAGTEGLVMASLTGHKIGAPVGVGLLVARPDVPLAPLGAGGGQQRGVRSGTLDAPLAAALAAALHETLAGATIERERLRALARRLREGILAIDPSARMTAGEGVPVADHVVHVLLPGADAQSTLFLLDQRGIDASAGSACSAGVTQASPVLAAMGVAESEARGALRLSLGWTSTEEDVDRLLAALPEVLERSRAVAALDRRA